MEVVRVVELKVVFEEWENPQRTHSQADVTVAVGPVQY